MLKRTLLAAAAALLLRGAWAAGGEGLPAVEVFLPNPCLACIDWGEHLMNNGFKVTFRETADMAALKHRLGVPADVQSVPTARVGGYFVEGHVPADDIKQLLKEMPKARGIAVPGLPRGAPGYEGGAGSGQVCESGCTILDRPADAAREVRREMYDTLLVAPNGKTSIFARH